MDTNCRLVYSWKQITKSPLGCGAERMKQMVEYRVFRAGRQYLGRTPYDVFLALYGLVDNEDAMAASDWAEHASFGETYHGSDYVVEVVDDEN